MQQDILLKDYTTFGIGGKAKYFWQVKSKQELIEAVQWAKNKGVPFFVLGGGSNLLVRDEGFDGLIIKLENEGCELQGHKMSVEAGTKLGKLVEFCLKEGLSGMEWVAGIPRAVLGGALFMNAGAFNQKIADIVEQVEVFDAEEEKIKTLSFTDCQFGYKQSIFKKNRNLIILSAVLKLEQREPKEVVKEVERVLEYRQGHHPMEFASAGSIFQNPPDMSAGELIEQSGLKGKQIGRAKIAEKHCNCIVNLGEARASDVLELIELIKKRVKDKFDVQLEEEIIIL